MANRKAVSKKVIKTQDIPPVEEKKSPVSYFKNPFVIVLLAVLVLALFAYKNPKYFVAAVINNKPIFAWDFNAQLQKKFGTRFLDQMIDETLVRDEAVREGVSATDKEIAEKVNQLQAQIGGQEAFSQFLNNQGLTPADLNDQIKLKILVDKMLAKKVTVSQKEVEDFLSNNKDSLPSTDSAAQRNYAEESLKQQKTNQEFQKWFTDLKTKSKIYKFF